MNYKLKTGFKKLYARAEGTNNANTNPAGFTCSKVTIETLEQGVKYV